MRIAMAQINTTVGNIGGNADRIVAAARQVHDETQADLVLFPELAVLGYPPRDLLLKPHLITLCEQAVHDIARRTADLPGTIVVGAVRRRDTDDPGTGLCNSAAVMRAGRLLHWYDKRLLPTYDVFDEDRYFDPGCEPLVVECPVASDESGCTTARVGVTICEDLWNEPALFAHRLYNDDVVADLMAGKPDVIVNLSASPFAVGKPAFRQQLFGQVARRTGCPVVMCNLVGGNDDLIFDGYSMALAGRNGLLMAAAPGFCEHVLTVDLAARQEPVAGSTDDLSDLFGALRLGVRDYVSKCGFSDVIVALSGGIDSAVVAAIAVAALGGDHVWGVGMPSRFSSEGSVDDARDLADRLGTRFDLVEIEPAHRAMLDMLQPLFESTGRQPGVAEENIQARLRGNIVMSLSNKVGALLLTTGNKSELAVGYCTLYGDMAGGLAVISDVPKTTVYALAEWMNRNHADIGFSCSPIPESTITKPPSAELKPDQTDQDTLPTYDVLDEIIRRYVEQHQSVQVILEQTGFNEDTVRRACGLIDRNEYKRRQMPTGLKVTGRAFGSGWRMPIAARFG
ncbi:MAG: NAD+ synthase [Planctomycetes bacterium]|nr:NAD+ synthase [Planctomycetota bacterium]NOG55307.1 NAD+ synthase [Planctomycetota bacterium]